MSDVFTRRGFVRATGVGLAALWLPSLARADEVLVLTPRWEVALPDEGLSSENRTTGFKNPGLQRVALGVNDRFEPFLRRHHGLKRRLRAAYVRVNGRAMPVPARSISTTSAPPIWSDRWRWR